MTTTLPALLDILSNPDNPAFAQALERLGTLTPESLGLADMSPEARTALLARLQSTIETLTRQTGLTTGQLTALRTGGQALQSYARKG